MLAALIKRQCRLLFQESDCSASWKRVQTDVTLAQRRQSHNWDTQLAAESEHAEPAAADHSLARRLPSLSSPLVNL